MSDPTLMHVRTLVPWLRPYAIAMVNGMREDGIPLQVISGRRTGATNRDVGGAERSLHLYGLAFDVAVEGVNREQLHPYFWQHIGNWWEGLGGRWGGRFSAPDVNHFDVGVAALVPR